MVKMVLVATSAAQDGRDDEFNDWYDKDHRGDICSLPGVISCRRFNASQSSPTETPAPYLAIYEIETDDPAAIFAEMRERIGSGEFTMTDSIDRSAARLWLWEERT